MGVYIKDKEMPESCYECAYSVEKDGICSITEGGCDWGHSRPPHCPLEEIDLVKCKVCKRCEERTTLNGLPFLYCLKMEVSVGSDQYCYWGERRNDE